MVIEFDEFGIYNVDIKYLEYLHDNIDKEVYYRPTRYETKPFLGLVVGIDEYTYFIPFTSCKQKHLKWKNTTKDHYIIYEIVEVGKLPENAVYKMTDENMAKHILAVLDMKKMIPVPNGFYSKVNFSEVSDLKYRTLLEKEYYFCQEIQNGILSRVCEIYTFQKSTGVVHKFYCNFKALEAGCSAYEEKS
ncbi:MAG: type III toxin-antitoxin system ToxN/AbiQ family toxin [Clostridiales bacterium]|nr:type III toxin-antitoxin system ToxN/AbiQ family toxin [Clostridiales bacterium]